VISFLPRAIPVIPYGGRKKRKRRIELFYSVIKSHFISLTNTLCLPLLLPPRNRPTEERTHANNGWIIVKQIAGELVITRDSNRDFPAEFLFCQNCSFHPTK
jgi:hypothetical protein